jgi:hypothetical protein
MWPSAGAQVIVLPPAIAHRWLVDGKFLQEVMSEGAGSSADFTRIAYFDYNAVTGRYEYFSIDTRAPQMMNERSAGPTAVGGDVTLYGGMFIAPQWGAARNLPFRYELVVGPIRADTQTVELYLTPLPASPGRKFLAFKYLYTRTRGESANGSGDLLGR